MNSCKSPEDLKGKKKEELIDEVCSLTDRLNDRAGREEKMKKVISYLSDLERCPMSIEGKLSLVIKIYDGVRIKEKKSKDGVKYIFETIIHGGWSSFHADTVLSGLDRLLFMEV